MDTSMGGGGGDTEGRGETGVTASQRPLKTRCECWGWGVSLCETGSESVLY